jgi:hypothetical protein
MGLCSLTAFAQQTTGDASQSSPATPGQTTPQSQTGTTKSRLLYALPNFMTVENADQVPPLTAGEKFKLTARGTFDPAEFVWYAALAGIAQAKGSEPEYGQGAEGYGKRFGEQFGDGTIKHRTLYSITRVFVTRSDSGTSQVNFSEILGSGGSAAISTYTYHPNDDRNFESVATTWGAQIGYDMISNVLKEFWPDVRRKFRKTK